MDCEVLKDLIDRKLLLELTVDLEKYHNPSSLTDISCFFSLVGISGFDVPGVRAHVCALKEGIKRASEIRKDLGMKEFIEPFIKISIGPREFLEEGPFTSLSDLEESVKECLSEGINIIEFHPGGMDEDVLYEYFETIKSLIDDQLISLNINRYNKSNAHLVNRSKHAFDLFGDKLMLQIDGGTALDSENSYHNTIQTIATADILIKDLKVKERRKFKKMPILLSGDINAKTAGLAKLCEIEYNGISVKLESIEEHNSLVYDLNEIGKDEFTRNLNQMEKFLEAFKNLDRN